MDVQVLIIENPHKFSQRAIHRFRRREDVASVIIYDDRSYPVGGGPHLSDNVFGAKQWMSLASTSRTAVPNTTTT